MVNLHREENIELAKRLQKIYNITPDDIYSRLPQIVRNNHITALEYATTFRQFAMKILKEETCLDKLKDVILCHQNQIAFSTGVKCNEQLARHSKCLDDNYKNDKVYESIQNRYLQERKTTTIINAIKQIAEENGYDPHNINEIY